MTAATHKYQLGQQVMLHRTVVVIATRATGVFEVTRLMPFDTSGEPAYRIRSEAAGERAVRESEIRPAI